MKQGQGMNRFNSIIMITLRMPIFSTIYLITLSSRAKLKHQSTLFAPQCVNITPVLRCILPVRVHTSYIYIHNFFSESYTQLLPSQHYSSAAQHPFCLCTSNAKSTAWCTLWKRRFSSSFLKYSPRCREPLTEALHWASSTWMPISP